MGSISKIEKERIVELIHTSKDGLDTKNYSGLHHAVIYEKSDLIEYALSKGADTSELLRNFIEEGLFAISNLAEAQARLKSIKYLIDNGADIKFKGTDGRDALTIVQLNFDFFQQILAMFNSKE